MGQRLTPRMSCTCGECDAALIACLPLLPLLLRVTPSPPVMTCPFGFSSLRQTQLLEKELRERDGDDAPASSSASSSSSPAAPSVPGPSFSPVKSSGPVIGNADLISPPLVNKPGGSKLPLSLFTGGLRTSLGVENAHPISVWMKELQVSAHTQNIPSSRRCCWSISRSRPSAH